ncbi:MAG: hypothetical protein EXR90_05970 [Methyloglobulus sp.]|nr:hypothetical protein [Methyloglobulus sp.]
MLRALGWSADTAFYCCIIRRIIGLPFFTDGVAVVSSDVSSLKLWLTMLFSVAKGKKLFA